MWLLSQHAGLGSPHSSGTRVQVLWLPPVESVVVCAVPQGAGQSLGNLFSFCAQGERSVTAAPGTCRVVPLMGKVTAFSPAGFPAVALLPSLWQPSSVVD